MDPDNRRTASAYINNLLLSRGLLRNGTPIEFATPEKAEGGFDGTMSKVMNLVHDMVLRRDRESDTLSTLSHNLQVLRTSSTQQSQAITRLENRNMDLQRQVALTGAQERSARATLKSAESRNSALREDMARLKGSVAQVRAQCATDARRRDGEIQRLKRHLEGRRGRDGFGGQVGVVVVAPGLSKGQQGSKAEEAHADLESPTYSLKQETNEFLTQLSQGLSDENDALIGLVRGTLATLRSLQGLPSDASHSAELDSSQEAVNTASGLTNGPPSYEALATDTDEVLEHLRGLLTNPSFVPLEEVEIREEEITRLREGWEKMAARWKEAVALMDGWKKRMVDTGDTINLEDLKMGLNLGNGIPSTEQAQEKTASGQGSEITALDDSDIQETVQDEAVPPLSEDPEANVWVDELDLDLHKTGSALGEIDANARSGPAPRTSTFPSISEENTKSLNAEGDASLLDFSSDKARQPSPSKNQSHTLLKTQPVAQSPAPTVQQKLKRAQLEAECVRKREEIRARGKNVVTKKLRSSRRRSTLSPEELEDLMGLF